MGLFDEMTQNGMAGLVACLKDLSRSWLPALQLNENLEASLVRRDLVWRAPEHECKKGPILYPLIHDGTIRVTAKTFCEITDAAFESLRRGTETVLVDIPLGRAKRKANLAQLQVLALAWRRLGLPVQSGGCLEKMPHVEEHLIDAARQVAFSQRNRDLLDLFISAAAAASGVGAVYVGQGLRIGRNLRNYYPIRSLGRLYGSTPFDNPPLDSKSRPAGCDAVWELAFTAEMTDGVDLGSDRDKIRQAVRERLARAWNILRREGCTARYSVASIEAPIAIRYLNIGDLASKQFSVVLPLLGSPRISLSTRALLYYVACVAKRRPLVVVDDINPRYLYSPYDVQLVHDRWRSVAKSCGCKVEFLSDRGPEQFAHDLKKVLRLFTGYDLEMALPIGLFHRVRGQATGYDAIHFATMAVASSRPEPTTIAIRSSNLRAVKCWTEKLPVAGIMMVQGLEPHSSFVTEAAVVRKLDSFQEYPV